MASNFVEVVDRCRVGSVRVSQQIIIFIRFNFTYSLRQLIFIIYYHILSSICWTFFISCFGAITRFKHLHYYYCTIWTLIKVKTLLAKNIPKLNVWKLFWFNVCVALTVIIALKHNYYSLCHNVRQYFAALIPYKSIIRGIWKRNA